MTEHVQKSPKRFHIKTFGCQMNVYDTERMGDLLVADGYQETADPADADLIVLNTCHIREKAAEKVYSELGRMRDVKVERQAVGHATIIAVAGCVAQAEGAEIVRRAPAVDLVIGPQSYHKLPDLIARAGEGKRSMIETDLSEGAKFKDLETVRKANVTRRAPSAFLTIQEGCDKFCTFCVVPYTRGAEYSRAVEDVAQEARHMVERGVREITLLGQNVNAYRGLGSDDRPWPLARLLTHLSQIDGLERLRYTTSHPRDMTDDLIAAHATLPKLMPYLHLPLQSGSNRLLAAMNRKHSTAEYLALVERVRAARPDMALSTDLIVGFPGETDRDFEQTLEIVHQVGFAAAYSFKYSPRPGTPAARLERQVAEEVKIERLHRLQTLLLQQQTHFNASCVGRTVPVLFEKPGRRSGQMIGRSPYLQSVHVEGDDGVAEGLLGRIFDVEIKGMGPNSLSGVIKAVRGPSIENLVRV